MALMSGFKRLLRLPRRDPTDEVDEEVQSHLEMLARDLVAEGLSEDEAHREARRRFGDVEVIRGSCRKVRTQSLRAEVRHLFIDGIRQDVSFGIRSLRSSPGFAAVAIITLGLGIGALTAMFTVFNGVVLQPLPFPEPERLVQMWELSPEEIGFLTSEPNFLDFRRHSAPFMDMAAWRSTGSSVTHGETPLRIEVAVSTAALFDLLGASPLLGRTFTEQEDAPGVEARVVVISHALWQSAYGGDTDIVGRAMVMDGQPYTVIGVMPAGFRFATNERAWIPLAANPGAGRGSHWLKVIGRMRPGVTLEQARAELELIAARLSTEYPDTNAGFTVVVMGLRDWLIGPVLTRRILLLQATAGLLLLIACINISSLLIARATARQREIGLRIALGANRGRVVRQLMTESLLLVFFGTALAIPLAILTVTVLRSVAPADIPRLDEVSINGAALLVTLGVSLITSVAFGLTPALHASRGSIRQALQRGGTMGEGRQWRLRSALVAGEFALATMLLVGSALLLTSFHRLYDTDPGFDPKGVLVVPLSLSSERYAHSGERRMAFLDEVCGRIGGLPGVRAVAASSVTPFDGVSGSTVTELIRPGMDPTSPESIFIADSRLVTPGYFEVMGIPLIRGRLLDEGDEWRGESVAAVISERLAREAWGDEDPIGKQIGWDIGPRIWCTVVGVVGDVRDMVLEWEISPAIYLRYRYAADRSSRATLLIKTEDDRTPMNAAVRQEIWEVDRNLASDDIRSLVQRRAASVSGPRLNSWLMVVFASLALLLTAVGVYGVMAFAVASRTVEFGVRMALGARSLQVRRMMLGSALKLTLVGTGLGLAGALGLARFIESVLYETTPTEPVILMGVAALLCFVALLAAFIPANRATRADPKLAMTTQ